MKPSVTILETPRLLLRTWSLDDVDAAWTMYSDPEVMRYIGTGETSKDLDDVRARASDDMSNGKSAHGFCMWATVEKASNQIIGSCGLQHLDGGSEIEVGYHFARAAWNKGYATESARASVEYGFEHLGLDRIMGVTNPANHRSQHVLEKVGLVRQGMGHYYGGEVVVFAIERSSGP